MPDVDELAALVRRDRSARLAVLEWVQEWEELRGKDIWLAVRIKQDCAVTTAVQFAVVCCVAAVGIYLALQGSFLGILVAVVGLVRAVCAHRHVRALEWRVLEVQQSAGYCRRVADAYYEAYAIGTVDRTSGSN